jgi:ElaB/YqjD/DUF883 family membrane-anchored ribosome-binding protein
MMKPELNEKPPVNNLPESLREVAQHATDVTKEAAQRVTDAVKDVTNRTTDATKEAAQHATNAAKEICQTVSVKAEDTMIRTKEYVRLNPVPVVLGAIAFGAALGYMIMLTRRHEPTFRERFAAEPLDATREAIFAALAPLSQRLHQGYDSARNGADNAMDKLHSYHPSRRVDSWADQIGRVGSNLKFW